jgi:hypothetical protein
VHTSKHGHTRKIDELNASLEKFMAEANGDMIDKRCEGGLSLKCGDEGLQLFHEIPWLISVLE